MAKLPRPQVHIQQEIVADSPTVVTPALVPVIIGPAYQIVSPLDDAGALNTDAKIITSAVLRSTGAVGDPVALSGLAIKIAVDGAPGQVIQFPITFGGAPLSHVVVLANINKQLTGAAAKFVDDKLVLTATSSGTSSRLSINAGAAYTAGNLALLIAGVAESIGANQYENQDFVLSYDALPSPMTAVTNLQMDGDEVHVHRWSGGVLTEFSKDSAPNATSCTNAATEYAGVARSLIHRPALGGRVKDKYRTKMIGVVGAGSKTNTVAHLGQEASVTIPLTHATTWDGTVDWPDVTGANYLTVTSVGLTPWIADQAASPGNYIGAAGNAIKVILKPLSAVLPAGTVTVTWNQPNKSLDIVRQATTCTFAALSTALDSILNLDPALDLTVKLGKADAMNAKAYWHAADLEQTYQLGGGEDPVNFGDAHSSTKAAFMGAVDVAAKTADDLGVAGEVITLAVDGAAPLTATLAGGVPVQVTLDLAFAAVATVTSNTLIASPDDPDASVATGGNYTPLMFVAAGGGADGPDSSLELSCSQNALEALFGGFKSKTESIVTGAISQGGDANWQATGRQAILTGGPTGQFNKHAVNSLDDALAPGFVDVTFTNMIMPAMAIYDVTNASLNGVAMDGATIGISLDSGAAENITFPQAAGGFVGTPTIGTIVSELNLSFIAHGGAVAAGMYAAEVNGRLVLLRKDAVLADTMEVLLAGVNGSTTSGATTLPALGGTLGTVATPQLGTCVNTTMRVKDDAAGNLTVLSVGNNFEAAHIPATFLPGSTSELTTSCLSGTAGEAKAEYSDGVLVVTLRGDGLGGLIGTAAKDEVATVLSFAGRGAATTTTSASIAYSRQWACATQAKSPNYTGQIFLGGADKVMPGDMFYNNGDVLARVVGLADLVVGTSTFPNAKILLSEYSVENKGVLSRWYCIAHDLPDAVERPNLKPEMVVSAAAEQILIKGALTRDTAGKPTAANATMYIEYSGLRKDISAKATDPAMLVFNSADEVATAIGPIVPENPLAFALNLAFQNRTNISISAMGIDAVTADAPFGTVEAYANTLDYLQKKEVYAMAPLSQNPEVGKLFGQHVTDMSAADKERIVFLSGKLPTEKVSTLVISGSMTISDIGGGKYEFEFEDSTLNVATAIDGTPDANGNEVSGAIGADYGPDEGIYLDRAGDAFKWLVTKLVSARVVQVETADVYAPGFGPGTGGNDDAYFQTDATKLVDFLAIGETCSILVRQPGISTATAAGRLDVIETMGDIAYGGFTNRRVFWTQPESVGVEAAGTEVLVPGFYLCAAEAARVGQFAPQQPHTNFQLTGFTRVVGSSDLFSPGEMDEGAGGGVWWYMQDSPTGPVFPRHHISTDISDLKTREINVTKGIDILAKAVRVNIRRQTGRRIITKQLLTELGISLQAVAGNYSGTGKALASASLTKLSVDVNRADGVVATLVVTPWYALNALTVTIIA